MNKNYNLSHQALNNSLRIKMTNKIWNFFMRSSRGPSRGYKSTADIESWSQRVAVDENDSIDKWIEIISQGNQDIVKTLKMVSECVRVDAEREGKIVMTDPMKNFRELQDVVKTFDDVNQFDRHYFLAILGADNLDDLDDRNRKKLERICLITHDNRQYCKFIESQILPQMQEFLDHMDESQLKDNANDRLDIDDGRFSEDIVYLESIVKFMEMERDDREQVFNFRHKMGEYVDFLRNSLQQDKNNLDISLEYKFGDTMMPVLVDRVVLKSVFSMIGNLCKNSSQADASKISVKCSLTADDKQDIVIKVRDNGSGIKEIKTEEFFDEASRRVQTKMNEDLSNSYSNINDVNRHEGTLNANAALISSGGTIRISDNVIKKRGAQQNHGVEFSMNVPTLNDDLTPELEAELLQERNVLVVDDVKRLGLRFTARDLLLKEDRGFKEFLRNDDKHYILRANGFNYVFVSDAIDAINVVDAAIKLGSTFDFVITDLFIPNIDGSQIIRMLKDLDSFSKTTFILNTGEKKEDIEDKTLFEDERVLSSDDGKGALVSYVSAMINERLQMEENDEDAAPFLNNRSDNLSSKIHEELTKMQDENYDFPSSTVRLKNLVVKMEKQQMGNSLNVLCLFLLL